MIISSTQRSIIKTLTYSKCFGYAVTIEQLITYLITPYFVSAHEVAEELQDLVNKKIVSTKTGVYVLKGSEQDIEPTIRRRQWSKKKKAVIEKALRRLKYIPTIQFIGLSGSIAMDNAGEHDDIDLFIISSAKSIWLTRLLSIVFLQLSGIRRTPGGEVKNKICLNMFVDEKNIMLKPYDRDIFSAHEIAQMKPLLDRNNTYHRFIEANFWTREYLGNSSESGKWKVESGKEEVKKNLLSTLYSLLSIPLAPLENAVKHLQLRYMSRKRTSEIITEGYLRFHPHDARKWVLPLYQKSVKKILKRHESAFNGFSQVHAPNPEGFFSSVH